MAINCYLKTSTLNFKGGEKKVEKGEVVPKESGKWFIDIIEETKISNKPAFVV